MIPYSRQNIDEDDIDSVIDVLKSDFLTTGPKVPEFEEALCEYVNAPYACVVSSATAALHVAMLSLGISKNDLVYVSAISFVASANCALYVGADVEFVDVNKYTGNMDLDCLENMLEKAQAQKKLPKAVICVHLSGRTVDLERLAKLKETYNFYLIEDASHSLGATYKDHRIGDCFYSDLCIMSFHPVKIITTAEGGVIFTKEKVFYDKLKSYSNHGVTHDKALMQNKNMPAFYYEQVNLGYNYRMSDIQAALGLSQLRKAPFFVKERQELAKWYHEALKDETRIHLPLIDTDDNKSSWHLYQITFNNDIRNDIYNNLRKRNIGVQVHYLPIYRHPYYQKLKKYPLLAGAEYFFNRTLTLPLFPNLGLVQRQLVVSSLISLLDKI